MYTVTIHQQDGDKGTTKNLTSTTFKAAQWAAKERTLELADRATGSGVLELEGKFVGRWHFVEGRPVWSTEEV